MNETIYVLYICDEWKSFDSLRLIGVANSFEKVLESVKKLLENKVIENNTGRKIDEFAEEDLRNLDYFTFTEVDMNAVLPDGSYYV